MNIKKSSKTDWFVNKRRKNQKHVKFVVKLFIISYVLFFASGFIPEKENISVTPLRTTIVIDGYKEISLIRWDYCKKQKRMEVELDIKDIQYQETIQRVYAIYDIDQVLPITIQYEGDGNMIIAIDNVPRKQKKITLAFSVENTDGKVYGTANFTNNVKDATKTDNLDKKTETQYQTQRINMDITYYADIVDANNQTIADNNERISNIEKMNEELTAKIGSLTSSEIEELNQTISNNKNQIQSLKENNTQLEFDNQSYNEKIEKLKERLESIK